MFEIMMQFVSTIRGLAYHAPGIVRHAGAREPEFVGARSEPLRRQAIQGKTFESPRKVHHNACSMLRPLPRDGLLS